MTALSHSSSAASKAIQRAVFRALVACLAFAFIGVGTAVLIAQVTGDRGIAPTASSADVEVRGIEVDVRAGSGEEARQQAWRQAQREAWAKAGGPSLPDGQISSLVSAVVIQREQIGPRRYIATLGVIFDRQRAGRYLGGAARQRASAPMLLVPVMVTGGAYTVYQVRNPWQRAWAEFNPGTSRIDYVRPTGAGGDSLLLTYGQTGRRSRAWWRNVLDQYTAADVLIPIAKLDYE
ncbi:MAG: heavy-metal-associated domain-containing protein, partial [Pseudomonadota bacterium]